MDCIPNIESLSEWLLHYGSFALFIALALGIIALPVPEETLMVIAGILISNEKLHHVPILAAAYGGSMCGITVSYIIGRTAGYYAIHKYGRWIGLTEARLQEVHRWFERFGTWALFIGYFIPGVRHFTGLAAGASALGFSRFALFAYCGAVCWVSTFVSLGYFFGNSWICALNNLEIGTEHLIIISIVITCIIAYFYTRKKSGKHPEK